MRYRTREQLRAALIIALLVALMAAWNAKRAHAEEPWVITSLEASYQINADGSVDVTEDYRVDFGSLRLKGIDRSVGNATGSDLHLMQVDVLSVDNGQTPLKYERRDTDTSFVISAGDVSTLLSGPQRFRFKYRVTRAVNAGDSADRFGWDIRGESPFARINSATITVSAPALLDVSCAQIPLSYLEKPVDCRPLDSSKTSFKFATTTDLGAVVGLRVNANLPKGAVSGAVVPTTPTTRGGAPTETTSQPSSADEGGFKPVPSAITVLVGLLGLALLTRNWRSAGANPARRVAINWLAIGFVFLVTDAFLVVSGIDPMEWQWTPVYLVLSVVMMIGGLVVGVIYLRRAGVLDRMFSGEDLLVHWTFTPEEWQANAEAEYERRRKTAMTNMVLACLAAGLIIVVMFFMASSDENASSLRLVGVAVAALVVGIVVIFNVLYIRLGDPRRGQIKDVRISLGGVYAFGALTTWTRNVSLLSEIAQVELIGGAFLGNMLDSVEFVAEPRPVLRFGYSYWTRAGKQWSSVEAPVPAGREAEALGVVAVLQGNAPPAPSDLATTAG